MPAAPPPEARGCDASLSRQPRGPLETEEPEPMNEADRAVCATHTLVTCHHRRQIGRMTMPERQMREKCGLAKYLFLVELLNLTFEREPGRHRDSNVKFAPLAACDRDTAAMPGCWRAAIRRTACFFSQSADRAPAIGMMTFDIFYESAENSTRSCLFRPIVSRVGHLRGAIGLGRSV